MKLPYSSFSILVATTLATVLGFSEILFSNSLRLRLPQGNALTFPPSGNRGAPASTTGGGTRGGEEHACAAQDGTKTPLVALMPNRENTSQTATAIPTLYWYVPETKAVKGEFVITDAQNQEVYYTSFALPGQSGIVKLSIPPQAALKVGQTYSWAFMIVCEPNRRNWDKYVRGTIEYVQLDAQQKKTLNSVKGLEKAKLTAKANLWAETLAEIAQLRSSYPKEWTELLKSVGLDSLVEKPFINCCKPE